MTDKQREAVRMISELIELTEEQTKNVLVMCELLCDETQRNLVDVLATHKPTFDRIIEGRKQAKEHRYAV